MASKAWQLARESAERYQQILSPAILGPFARALVDHAALREKERVVDVGCGTGDGARYAARAVGGDGSVTGVDLNAHMIDVARSISANGGVPVEWRVGDACRLPVEDGTVDVVLCAQTLQFLPEKDAALKQMARALRSGGRLGLSLWCELDRNPYFEALVEAMARNVGPETADGLRAAFGFSDRTRIERQCRDAGLENVATEVVELQLSLPPPAYFVPRHISATPMDAGFRAAPAPVRQSVIREMIEKLAGYRSESGVRVPFRSMMIVARR